MLHVVFTKSSEGKLLFRTNTFDCEDVVKNILRMHNTLVTYGNPGSMFVGVVVAFERSLFLLVLLDMFLCFL